MWQKIVLINSFNVPFKAYCSPCLCIWLKLKQWLLVFLILKFCFHFNRNSDNIVNETSRFKCLVLLNIEWVSRYQLRKENLQSASLRGSELNRLVEEKSRTFELKLSLWTNKLMRYRTFVTLNLQINAGSDCVGLKLFKVV